MTQYMEKGLRIDYLKRLFTPYKKNGNINCFLFQYLQGSGNELKEKFWSEKSSSRLCFDLYSWMGSDPSVSAIEFELKLPGIKSGGRQISPNMDVYFETKDGIYFIESKYTETVNNKEYKNNLPQAYWKTDNHYKSVSGKDVYYPIIDRYHKYKFIMDEFVQFTENVDNMVSKEDEKVWFDAKQETCHLLGIALYAVMKKPGKPIHFFNVAANYCSDKPLFAEAFRARSEEMLNRIFAKYSVGISFDYQLCSVRDFFGRMLWLDKKGYATDRTVRELISEYSEPIR